MNIYTGRHQSSVQYVRLNSHCGYISHCTHQLDYITLNESINSAPCVRKALLSRNLKSTVEWVCTDDSRLSMGSEHHNERVATHSVHVYTLLQTSTQIYKENKILVSQVTLFTYNGTAG